MNKKMTTSNDIQQGNWSYLPTELLESISSKLSIFDMLSFRAVCSSWRVAGKTISSEKVFPLLIFYTDCHPKVRKISEINNVCFVNISDEESTRRRTQYDNVRKRMVGSHPNGWLVLLYENGDPYLLKLLPHTRIQLPKIKKLLDLSYTGHIFKALVSVHPGHGQDLIVIIRYHHYFKKLVFWRFGDDEWTSIGNKGYNDIVFNDSTLYSLRVRGRPGIFNIEAWDFGAIRDDSCCSPEKKLDVDVYHCYHWERNYKNVRLEISPETGEILIFASKKTIINREWIILKADLSLTNCIKVDSLDGAALLLGKDSSIFVSSNDVKDYGYKPNSIYSLDYWLKSRSFTSKYIVLRNYGLEDGKIEDITDSCGSLPLGFALVVLSIESLSPFLTGPL